MAIVATMKNVISTISITGFDTNRSGLSRTIESSSTLGERMSEENFLRSSSVDNLVAMVSVNIAHLWIEESVTLQVRKQRAQSEKGKERQHYEDQNANDQNQRESYALRLYRRFCGGSLSSDH